MVNIVLVLYEKNLRPISEEITECLVVMYLPLHPIPSLYLTVFFTVCVFVGLLTDICVCTGTHFYMCRNNNENF
jgi:hypothetical protein